MAKAKPTDMQRMGFAAAQFGNPGDWLAVDGYLAEIIDSVAAFVSDEVGADTYANATGVTAEHIKDAEKQLTAGELWRRRAAFLDGSASLGNTDTAYLTAREYLANGEAAEERGLASIARVTGSSVRGGLAVGIVESGRFVESTA